MRVIVAARLFSGLIDSIAEKCWKPKGVPTISRLLEGLAARPDIELETVLAVKDRAAAKRFPRAERFRLEPIGSVSILPWRRLPGPLRRFEGLVTELDHLVRLSLLVLHRRPHALYCTNAHLIAAGLLARLGVKGIVLRLMGLFPFHREMGNGHHRLARWMMRAPFARMVCTQDGSGPEVLLPRLIDPDVPLAVSINGVDIPELTEPLREQARLVLGRRSGRPLILFLGRLESYKGCHDFVSAALAVLAEMPEAADFILVGDGTEADALRRRIEAAQQTGAIRLTGAQPSSLVPALLAGADVYVSLNHHGNLSNANLEALAAGCRMLMPKSDPATGIDLLTDNLLPPDIVPRFEREDMARGLATTLKQILAEPRRIGYLQQAVRQAVDFIKPWNVRTAEEIALIVGIASAKLNVTVEPNNER